MKKILILCNFFLFYSCFHETCETKLQKINDKEYDFTIIDNYNKNHSNWILGLNIKGGIDTFQYYSFQSMTNLAKKNSQLIKHKGEPIFKIKNANIIYILKWDCLTGGGLLDIDTITNSLKPKTN